MRTSIAVLVALVLGGTAHAAGPSTGLMNGGEGVSGRHLTKRFVTLISGSGTVVAEIRAPGNVTKSRTVRGLFGIPMITLDGTTDGLSFDGKTLVLGSWPSGRALRTKFAILGTRNLRVREVVSFHGRWEFDALSPDGRTLYLIQHLGRNGPRYVVRAYDLERGLLPQLIRDPREKERTMHGYPMARTSSADGRWVYTLYDDPSVHSFVHALDTVGRAARCIDLPATHGSDTAVAGIELSADGREVIATWDTGEIAGVIDTRTHSIKASPHDAQAAFEALREAIPFV